MKQRTVFLIFVWAAWLAVVGGLVLRIRTKRPTLKQVLRTALPPVDAQRVSEQLLDLGPSDTWMAWIAQSKNKKGDIEALQALVEDIDATRKLTTCDVIRKDNYVDYGAQKWSKDLCSKMPSPATDANQLMIQLRSMIGPNKMSKNRVHCTLDRLYDSVTCALHRSPPLPLREQFDLIRAVQLIRIEVAMFLLLG